MDIQQAEQAYMIDPVFHALVDAIKRGICAAEYTPSEVRAAAMLACIQFENERVRNRVVPSIGKQNP